MESYLFSEHFDLVTPDGRIIALTPLGDSKLIATIHIENISSAFVGFKIEREQILFNLKSTLAQLGVNALLKELVLDPKNRVAEAKIELYPIGKLGAKMLSLFKTGAYIGKLFAADERRRVRDPDYLARMFGRADRHGKPLLSLGGLQGNDLLVLEKIEGRTVAFIAVQEGILAYDSSIEGFLPTLAKALLHPELKTRTWLHLNQQWKEGAPRRAQGEELLLVRTLPLYIRTVFGRVVDALLPHGFFHTSASVLEPDTLASGDIYELHGSSEKELTHIPLEFYTLEPHREYIFFSDRDQLQSSLENPETLFRAFETAPAPSHHRAALFVVKGEQLSNLTPQDWITRETRMSEFPGSVHPDRQAILADRYIKQQPSYPFLKAIEDDLITSQGVLLVRYFPSPLMKRLLLSEEVNRCLKRIYFQYPSLTNGDFFSHEDRSMLLDLAKFGIPVFWVDKTTNTILQYVPKPEKDSGMFVPLPFVETFIKATVFGIYGSNLLEGNFEEELTKLLEGIQKMRTLMNHPLLNKETPIALVTGGGPGVMEVGNRIARSLHILSCANITDFRGEKEAIINEQRQNRYIDAKMTYSLDRLVERQAEFNLDFPIFLIGGIGTDFEFALEAVRRKVAAAISTPVLLFGNPNYWRKKITPAFQTNLNNGTISGSEWIGNCFFCIQNAQMGLQIYTQYFSGTLPIGKDGPIYDEGFVTVV